MFDIREVINYISEYVISRNSLSVEKRKGKYIAAILDSCGRTLEYGTGDSFNSSLYSLSVKLKGE